MKKDDIHCLSLCFPRFITDFIPNLHLTHQGILCKNRKNDQLVWDGSFLVDETFKSVSIMVNTNNEPELTYGATWYRQLQRIWNTKISYPTTELLLFDDDVKELLIHCKCHLYVPSAFACTASNRLYFPLEGIFGPTISSENFEPIGRTRTHLVQRLFHTDSLIFKQKAITDKFKYSAPLNTNQTYV